MSSDVASDLPPESPAHPDNDTRSASGARTPLEERSWRVRLRRLWEPHEGQTDIMDSDTRFRVLSCGRRFGKTTLAAHAILEAAASTPDSLNWWVAPSYRDTNTGFEILTDIIPDGWDTNVRQSSPKEITFRNDSRIQFLSTDSRTGLVGVGLDFLVVDEAAQVPENVIQQDLRPTLSDTLGKALFISTPRGRNWFHKYFERGRSGDYPSYDSWQRSTYANPHIPESEIDEAREDVPERVFEQEYLAKFIEDTGGVFGNVRELVIEDYDWEQVDGTRPYTVGVDFARHQDYTAIIALDSTKRLVGWRRMRDVSWPQIQTAVEEMAARYPGEVRVDASRDNKIVADLEAAGLNVEPIKFSPQKKRQLIENLITQIETQEITIPDIPQLVSELNVFEYTTTRAGNVRYHAPSGFSDDAVDALALAADVSRSKPTARISRPSARQPHF